MKISFGGAAALAAAGALLAALPGGAAAADDSKPWYETLTFSGSARVRYEWLSNEAFTAPDQWDRNRYRYQLLLGFAAKPDPQIDVGFRLGSSGNSNNQPDVPSQNVTLDDAFRDDPLYLDRAYITWRPDWHLTEEVLGLSLTGGKFDNPNRSLSLMWGSGVTPEGAYALLAPPALAHNKVSFVEGFFVIEEEDQTALGGFSNGDDAYLLSHQLRWAFDDVGPHDYFDLDFWAGYYRYVRPSLVSRGSGNLGFGNNTNAGGRLTSEFGILDFGGRARFSLFDLPASAALQWAHNDDARAIPATGRIEDDLWTVEATLGKVARRGDWALSAVWGSVEADAVIAGFMSPDWFSGLGSTNVEGVRLAGEYGVTDHAKFGVAYLNTGEEDARRLDPDQEIVQADFSVAF